MIDFLVEKGIIDRYEKIKGMKYTYQGYGKKKKSRFKFTVKDGWLTMNIELKPELRCQCGGKLCDHILLFLIKQFRLSFFVISMLSHQEVYTRLLDLIEDENIVVNSYNRLLYDTISEMFGEEECGICGSEINDPEYGFRLHKCVNCEKYNHAKCVKNWYFKRNEEKNKSCIYCRKAL